MPSFPDQLLSRLSERLAEQMGWDFPRERWRELEAGIEAAARELNVADATAYARDLLAAQLTKRQIEVLAGALTVGETYFFRDARSFETLAEHVFAELIRARRGNERRLRIWSAGCCTGEEAYSVAILLDQLLPDISDWQITLLATDINTRFLQKAVEGTFSEWSFRGAPLWLKERYFRPVAGHRFALLPRIKSLVTFAHLNLGEDVYPSLSNNTNAMDLILCRNVLMYFSAERAGRVIRNFHRSLVTNGVLLVSAVETSLQFGTHFVATPFAGATLYRKNSEFDSTVVEIPPKAAPTIACGGSDFAALLHASEYEVAPVQQEAPGTDEPSDVYATALALFERGRYVEAASTLRADVDAAAPAVDSATLLARIYANLGDLSEARSWAEHAIAADKTNAMSHYLRAVILQEQSLIADALTALQRTLYLEPDFVLAHFALGNLEQRQGRRRIAARHFSNALHLLGKFGDNEVLPHSGGMAAGQLKEMLQSISPVDVA
jgi:chemotaxis protein methyltransferase CheR